MEILKKLDEKLNKKLGYLGFKADLATSGNIFSSVEEETKYYENKQDTIKNWQAQEGKQEKAFNYITDNETNIIGYGGSRGSGKTEVGINASIALMLKLKGAFNGIYLRNKASDLIEVISRLKTALYRENIDFSYNGQYKIFTLKNGAVIRFFYCDGDGLESLQGSNISHIFLEEPQYFKQIDIIVAKLSALWRSSNKNICLKQIWLFNPLGASTKYLKKHFVEKGEEITIREDGNKQVFVFATMNDNKLLLEAQPNYIKQLENLPEGMKKAWLYGSFDVTSGLAFDILTKAKNGFEDATFKPDAHPWYISMDWGFRENSAVGFYCVYKNDIIIKFDEIVFSQKTPQEAALLIKTVKARYSEKHFKFAVADNAIWNEVQGESIGTIFQKQGLYFKKVTKDRETGFLKLYELIKNQQILFYNNLRFFWETVPSLLISETKQADIENNPKQEDHIYDETRYMVMSLNIHTIK